MNDHVRQVVTQILQDLELIIVVLEQAVLLFPLTLKPVKRQVCLHPCLHFGEVKWLHDVVHPAHGEGLDLVQGLAQRADEKDGNRIQRGI